MLDFTNFTCFQDHDFNAVLSRIDRKLHSYARIYNCTQDSGDFIRLECGVCFLQHRTFELADTMESTGILCAVNFDISDPSDR